jgi:hypothetical protein
MGLGRAVFRNVNRATVARRLRRALDVVRRGLRKQLSVLYPREDSRALDGIALAACHELIPDPAVLLQEPTLSTPDSPAKTHYVARCSESGIGFPKSLYFVLNPGQCVPLS